jgi:hypothetical protein
MQATSCPAVSSPVGRSSDPTAFRLSAERVSPVREIGKLERTLFLPDYIQQGSCYISRHRPPAFAHRASGSRRCPFRGRGQSAVLVIFEGSFIFHLSAKDESQKKLG